MPDSARTPLLHPPPNCRRVPARKPRLGFLLAVTGADGHRAVVSWAEIDPDFGGQQILLATTMDGAALDDAGPQLVVPADHCGARYVSGVTAVWLGPAPRA